jgi:hypothetical protein
MLLVREAVLGVRQAIWVIPGITLWGPKGQPSVQSGEATDMSRIESFS